MARKATWQRHVDPRERLHGTDVAQTRGKATRVHVDAWVAPTWHESVRLASDGPTGIVGLGYSIGAVTHLR